MVFNGGNIQLTYPCGPVNKSLGRHVR